MRFKTLKYHYKANNDEIAMLKFLCRISKNLYNAALNMIKKYKTKPLIGKSLSSDFLYFLNIDLI